MDIKTIKALASIVHDMNLSSIEVEEGDLKIKIHGPQTAERSTVATKNPQASLPAYKSGVAEVSDKGLDFNAIYTLKAPMVGVFYAAENENAKPFVTVGSKVKKGDVLCIIEAMKLMNEITTDRDGEIVDICVSNGDIVEFGQTLFKIF